jgi:hypothetical protein
MCIIFMCNEHVILSVAIINPQGFVLKLVHNITHSILV